MPSLSKYETFLWSFTTEARARAAKAALLSCKSVPSNVQQSSPNEWELWINHADYRAAIDFTIGFSYGVTSHAR